MKFKIRFFIPLLLLLTACGPSETNSNQSNNPSQENTTSNQANENQQENTSKPKSQPEKQEENLQNQVLSWYDIPYAESVAGANRFGDSVKTDGMANMSQYEEANQEVFAQYDGSNVRGSEDALNINVYRPNSSSSNLPVLVYLHGGNNQVGSNYQIDGSDFVKDRDAVVVTINYRLGSLGFNPLPAAKNLNSYQSGNIALIDMLTALNWIQENINDFGGNPNNITVAGFSAGASNLLAMLSSPEFEGTFDKAISMSGLMTTTDPALSQEVFARAFAPLVVEDDLAETEAQAFEWLLSEDSEVSDYLQDLPLDRIVPLMAGDQDDLYDFPYLYRDGELIAEDGFQSQFANDVPVLLIGSSNETSTYIDQLDYLQALKDQEVENYEEQKDFIHTYGSFIYNLMSIWQPAERLVQDLDSEIYTMEISYGQDSELVGEEMAQYGAFHGVMLPLLDPSHSEYENYTGEAFQTKPAQELSTTFQDYIYSFMVDGDPNAENLPRWPAYSTEDKQALELTADEEQVVADEFTNELNPTTLLEKMLADESLSYETKSIIIDELFEEHLSRVYSLSEAINNAEDTESTDQTDQSNDMP